MGIIKAFSGALTGTLADQWKDIIIPGVFDEHSVVVPGVLRSTNRGRGSNLYGSEGIISKGSKIFIPENTAAFIFSESGIENILTEPGGYVYQDGQDSIFNGDGLGSTIIGQIADRIGYGGIAAEDKRIAYVNLREIRDIKFGTKGAQVYHDRFYGTDLEIFSYGSFTVQVIDPVRFITAFVPPNVYYYTFDDMNVRSQIIAEFLQSFIVALNSLSEKYRISQLPAQANELARIVANDQISVGTWPARFGFSIVQVAIENIEFTEASRELVRQYSSNKMNLKAYEDVSQNASNIAAQQAIAQGIKENGLGNGGGMVFGMNMAQGLNTQTAQQNASQNTMTFDQQIEAVKKLKELLDIGVLTEEEFNAKKKEIMNL